MASSYDASLVVLSIFIAIFASYAALDLAGRVTAARGQARLGWLGGGAIAMGFGIWSMHYIGMLAFTLPIPVRYDWPTVVVSLLAAIFASGVALYVASRRQMGPVEAVAWRYFHGRQALPPCTTSAWPRCGFGRVRLQCWVVAFSYRRRRFRSGHLAGVPLSRRLQGGRVAQNLSAVVMGAAIPLMHYTGMAAATFTSTSVVPDMSHAISISTPEAAIATFIVLSVALLTSMVDRRFSAQAWS